MDVQQVCLLSFTSKQSCADVVIGTFAADEHLAGLHPSRGYVIIPIFNTHLLTQCIQNGTLRCCVSVELYNI